MAYVVGVQQVGVELFLHHHVGDGEFGFPFVHSADGEHTEIVEQTHEIIRFLRKAVIVVPWFHHSYQFVDGVTERAVR